MNISINEFHINKAMRDICGFDKSMYSSSGNVIFSNFKAVQEFQIKINQYFEDTNNPEKKISAGNLNAMGLIDEIFHVVCSLFRQKKAPLSFTHLLEDLDASLGKEEMNRLFSVFMTEFPPTPIYQKKLTNADYLFQSYYDPYTGTQRDNREQMLEEMIMLHLANENPAFHKFLFLFDDTKVSRNANYVRTWNQIKAFFKTQPVFGSENNDLITMLKEPVNAAPTSLKGQLDYIRTHWGDLLEGIMKKILESMDVISEEQKPAWNPPAGWTGPDSAPYSYDSVSKEYERFSPDSEWMPRVVLMAKTVLVWMDQLSQKYQRTINHLDEIPDAELDALRDEGFTGLWLIGLWERSKASKRIKQICGNPEAAASAYSLLDYDIAENLGGWDALDNLRRRCWARGIRLASDMVPNHTGMDGKWVIEHPEYFISRKDCPFPQYSFNGENLSTDGRVSLYLEDHYYSKEDCAVCFKRVDNQTGDVTYIYHGNDGTGLPWNDTAQIDYLNPEAREQVMQKILHVARNFPIIRFDAAMVLARKHVKRLWYPEPGHGGDIATRSQYALTPQEFDERCPNEFWREVVDRCANELPDTLLLAEAFWMMEGYFTRTLGMHRVYNSAFMNMLKREENQKYRDTVKNTIKFDPQVLKRFVNFMNNPDEEPAVAQFGKSDKYFGVCTLMSTMPGLPMFGHGQLEGFEEKYGMEYTKAYRNEQPDENLMNRHRKEIFPLLRQRYLFSGVENFLFYDVWNEGVVNENVFAYSNSYGTEKTLVFYNNKYETAAGWIKESCEYAVKNSDQENDVTLCKKSLAEGFNLSEGENNYCIFHEHVSGLWYIRKCDDLIKNGMFVALNGFQTQVYMDIQQVEDTYDNKYSFLCKMLNGSGTPNLETAWEEYKYNELYKKLADFLSVDFLKQIHILFTPIPQLKAMNIEVPVFQQLIESVKDKALAYYEKEAEFAEMIDSQKKILKSTFTKKSRHDKKIVSLSPEKRFALFERQLKFLVTTQEVAQGVSKGTIEASSLQYTKARPSFKVGLENQIYEGIAVYEAAPEILICAAAVSTAGEKNCIKWNYARKLADLIYASNNYTSDIQDVFKRIFITGRIKDYNLGASSQIRSSYDAAKLLLSSADSYFLSGINIYNNIRWFNKERFESTLWFAFATNVTYSSKVTREEMYRLFRMLVATKEASGYDCDKFLAIARPAKTNSLDTAKIVPDILPPGVKPEGLKHSNKLKGVSETDIILG